MTNAEWLCFCVVCLLYFKQKTRSKIYVNKTNDRSDDTPLQYECLQKPSLWSYITKIYVHLFLKQINCYKTDKKTSISFLKPSPHCEFIYLISGDVTSDYLYMITNLLMSRQTTRRAFYKTDVILTFWRRIFFSNFSTPCI